MATYPTSPALPQGVAGTDVDPTNWNKFVDNINAIGADLVDARGDGQTFPGTPHTSGQSSDIDNMLQSIRHMIADITGETNWFNQVATSLAVIARASITFGNDDATPSIATAGRPIGMCHTATANTGALDVTDLDNGSDGQIIIVLGGDNSNKTTLKAKTVEPTSNLNLRSDWQEAENEVIIVIYDSAQSEWIEISRSPEAGGGSGGDNNDLTTSDATGGNQVVTIPSAVGRGDELRTVSKVDTSTNTVRVDYNSNKHHLKYQYHAIGLMSDGSDWYKLFEQGEVFNVKDFGATGDGVTDDTAAIQAAIAAAPSAAHQIPTIYFPNGWYYVSGELDVTKNLYFMGQGLGTHVYQSSTTLNLFHCTCTGQVIFENMKLGSEATTAGKCLILLEYPASHAIIRNVFMTGGYYGIGLYGALFVLIEHVCNTTSFYRAVAATNQCWIHSERSTVSSNALTLSHCILQGGTAGVELSDNNSEGSLAIIGGCIESFTTGPAVYISGYKLGISISGLHNEGGADSKLEFSGCSNVLVSGCFVQSLTMTGCINVGIEGCYLYGDVTIDSTSEDIRLSNNWLSTTTSSISARSLDMQNVRHTSSAYFRGHGTFFPVRGFRNMCDGDLEIWDDSSQPLGFVGAPVAGCVVEETSIVRFGSKSAKVIAPAGQTGANLKFTLDSTIFDRTETFFPRYITVRFWAYKPAANGFNPKITVGYTGLADSGAIFSLATETWTPCQQSFRLASGYASPYILIGRLTGEISEGEYIYVDGVTITQGDEAPPTFDDSMGKEGNFRVSGNSLRGGEVSTMTGNETFTYSDGNMFIKDPGGAARNFDPSGAFPERAEVVLINTADAAETITFDSGVLAEAVAQNERGWFVYDGALWRKIYVGS